MSLFKRKEMDENPELRKEFTEEENQEMQAVSIREADERARLLIDAMPLSCHLWDRNLNMFDLNEASLKIFQVNDRREFIERFFEFSPEYQPDGRRSAEVAATYLKQAFDEGRAVFEFMHQLLDGTPLPCEMTLVRIRYGNDYAVAAYARDLREQKQMMSEIQEATEQLEAALAEAKNANEAKSAFLANMSHEMRTPMNAIIGLSELLLGDTGIQTEVHENLDKIYTAGMTLLSIINDILDISKIESGRFDLIPTEYDLPSFINDTIVLNIIRIGEKPIEFKLRVSHDLPSALIGDDLRLKQICNNLLSNAIKYTRAGYVEWDIHHEDDADDRYVWLTIRVEDTGIGIRQEDIPKLFSNYSQLETKSNRKIEGTGLGLSLTKSLVEMMGGSITVESEYGKGSVFTARIRQKRVTDVPIGLSVARSLRTFQYTEDKFARSSQFVRVQLPYCSVLVVDDMPTNLDVAKGMLKPYGMQVDCVTSGQEAIDLIRAEKVTYCAIFMDHMMPEMDGIEATRIIREEIGTEYAQNVPIIALTANAIVGNEDMFLRSGFQAFLSKPIDMKLLDSVIRRWVRDKALEKSIAEQRAGTNGPEAANLQPAVQQQAVIYETQQVTAESNSGDDKESNNDSGRQISKGEVAGLNISEGIDRFGDEEIYYEILGSFVRSTPAMLEQMREVTAETLADYAIVAHGIKGSSLSICADELGRCAEKLELAAKAGDYEYIRANNEDVIKLAQNLIAGMSEMLGNRK